MQRSIARRKRHPWLGVVACCLFGKGLAMADSAKASIPVTFHLAQPGYVTLVAEDPKTGRHIANLLSDQPLAAGDHQILWDGYDSGQEKRGTGWVRQRVAPGEYRLTGLVHDAIHLRYEFPVYSPGIPPWRTADGGGAWLADHSPPSSVLYLPPNWGSPFGATDQGQMLLSANVGEAGWALLWTDLNGKPIHGAKIKGWMGGKAMARDPGPNRDTSVCAYTVYTSNASARPNPKSPSAHPNGFIELDAITTNSQDTFDTIWRHDPARPPPEDGFQSPLSVSVFNGIAAVSCNLDDKVYFVDVKAKQEIGSADLPLPRGVAWDSQGGLYAVSNGAVKHYTNVQPTQSSLGLEAIVVPAQQLDDPRQLLLDENNRRLYVSQWGKSHQVKVFDLSSGHWLLTIGHPGGPQTGPYDDQRMHHPNGMALAPSPGGGNQLWVMEDDFIPKRVSVWQPTDGSLVKAYYGPPQYGGGGTLDPADPTRLFYASVFNFGSQGGMIFKLNWDTGESKLTDIYALGPQPKGENNSAKHLTGPFEQAAYDVLPEDYIPERPVYINGQTYLVGTYNGWARSAGSGTVWKFDEKTGVAAPVAFVGGGTSWIKRQLDGTRGLPNKPVEDAIATQLKAQHADWPDVFMTWSDLNGNHRSDPEEWTVRTFPPDQTAYTAPDGKPAHATYFSGASLSPTDLSYTGGWAVTVPAPMLNADGIPIYDLSKAKFNLPLKAEFRGSVDYDTAARFDTGPDGWLLQWPQYGWKNGELMWTYPVSDRRHPPSGPGDMLAVNHLMGPLVTPTTGEAGPIAFMENDYGALYLMTVDGFFVQTLGGDERTAPLLDLPEAKRGMLLDNYSFSGEHWHTTVTQFRDGRIGVVAGKEFCGIFTVLGLDSARRVDLGTVTVTPDQMAALPEDKIIARPLPNAQRPADVYKTMSIALLDTPPTVDGDLSDWPTDTQWVNIGTRGQGTVGIAKDRLYAAWKTSDPTVLKNAGGQLPFLFKSGGALDLMLSADLSPRLNFAPRKGDLRLLATMVNGKVQAALYEPVKPGASNDEQVTFASPVGSITFDSVTDVSGQVQVAQQGDNYELSVPLSVLGLDPQQLQPGRTVIRGDIGLLRGEGGQTVERVYWSNEETAIISDVPSEARLQPANWGEFHLTGHP